MRFEGFYEDLSSSKLLNTSKFFIDLRKNPKKRKTTDQKKLKKYLSIAESAAMIIDYRKTGIKIQNLIKKKHPNWVRPQFRHIVCVMMNDLIDGKDLRRILSDYRLEIADEVCGYLRTYIIDKEKEERERRKDDVLAYLLG